MRACPNCRERNPDYKRACLRCNAPLTSNERERRRELRRESELRELNGKEPLDVPETDETVEPREGGGGGALLMLVLLALVIMGVVALSAGWLP